MSRIMRCKDLNEAVECLQDQGDDGATIAAYLYAAGVSKRDARKLLTGAGFKKAYVETTTEALYTCVVPSVVDRLRTLRTLAETTPQPQ